MSDDTLYARHADETYYARSRWRIPSGDNPRMVITFEVDGCGHDFSPEEVDKIGRCIAMIGNLFTKPEEDGR